MPGLEQYLRDAATQGDASVSMTSPESIPLHLPSSLPSKRWPMVYVPGLAEVEDHLRYAQAFEALTELRCQLMKRTYASRYRTANISSQTHFTRFRELLVQTESKIKAASSRYRLARSRLINLRGTGDWVKMLRELHPEDVRGLSEKALVNEEKELAKKTRKMAGISTGGLGPGHAIENDPMDKELPPTVFNPHLAVGEGHRTLSWIWYSTSNDEILGDTNTTTRTRSCKSFTTLVPLSS